MAQEEFNSPNPRTGQGTRDFLCHILRIFQHFGRNSSRLETFTVISSFLHVTDRLTEQSRPVLLGHRQQRNFTVERNKLLYNDFFHIATCPRACILPGVCQIRRTVHLALPVSGRTHQRLDDAGEAYHIGRSLQLIESFGITIIRRFQSKFRMSQLSDFFSVHGEIHSPGTRYDLNAHLLAIIQFLRTDGFYFGDDNVRFMLFHHSHQRIPVKHVEDLALVCYLHSRCMCIRIASNYILPFALARNDKLFS